MAIHETTNGDHACLCQLCLVSFVLSACEYVGGCIYTCTCIWQVCFYISLRVFLCSLSWLFVVRESVYCCLTVPVFHTPFIFFFIFFSFLLISRCLPRQSLRPLLSAEFKRKSSILCAQIHMENQGIMVAAHDEDGLT